MGSGVGCVGSECGAVGCGVVVGAVQWNVVWGIEVWAVGFITSGAGLISLLV